MTKVTFEGIKYSYRQGKDGHVLAFVVHPANMPEYVALAPIGSRVMVTLTEIDEKPAEQPKPEKRYWQSMRRSQQAGVLCADSRFRDWLAEGRSECDEEDAAHLVRSICGVKSRTHLDDDFKAAGKWDALVIKYRQATGQMAEAR